MNPINSFSRGLAYPARERSPQNIQTCPSWQTSKAMTQLETLDLHWRGDLFQKKNAMTSSALGVFLELSVKSGSNNKEINSRKSYLLILVK